MKESAVLLGEKIRTLRLNRKLTQAQLAGTSVTRNMLSLIENGNAMPSLDTLIDFAQRLEVPVGYFFTSDEEEIAQFHKMNLIYKIRSLFQAQEYKECLEECAVLPVRDDEIRMIEAESYFALAGKACRADMLSTALSYLRKAEDAAKQSSYISESVLSDVHFTELLIRSVNMANLPRELCTPSLYPGTRIPPQFFLYLSAIQHAERGETEALRVLLEEGWILDPACRDYLSACLAGQMGDDENAAALLKRVIASAETGFFTRYHALTDYEKLESARGNYKTAYQLSTQKFKLLEQFAK